MGNLDLSATLATLHAERSRAAKELAKLDKAIAVILELAGTNSTLTGHAKKHTLSAAGRRNITKGQKLRWAKVRAKQKAKG
jgi:hypothetical protein